MLIGQSNTSGVRELDAVDMDSFQHELACGTRVNPSAPGHRGKDMDKEPVPLANLGQKEVTLGSEDHPCGDDIKLVVEVDELRAENVENASAACETASSPGIQRGYLDAMRGEIGFDEVFVHCPADLHGLRSG